MKNPPRLALLALLLGIILFLGLLFAPFVVDTILLPLAMSIWLFLRLFILSVDQKYYWALLAILGAIFTIRHLRRDRENGERVAPPAACAARKAVDLWRANIQLAAAGVEDHKTLQKELTTLLVSLHSFRHGQGQGTAYFDVYEPLKQRQIPLPEPVYAFLLAEAPDPAKPSLRDRLRSLLCLPRRRIRRWTGQEAAEYYRALDEALAFMETRLEMNHDHE